MKLEARPRLIYPQISFPTKRLNGRTWSKCNNLRAGNLEITRYFKIVYNASNNWQVSLWCFSLHQYQPLPFIVQDYALYYYRLNNRYNPFLSPCHLLSGLLLVPTGISKPLPRGRWAHKHVASMVSFIHLFHLSTFSPFFRSDPFILFPFFPSPSTKEHADFTSSLVF